MTEEVPTPTWLTVVLVGHQMAARATMEKYRLLGYETSLSQGYARRSFDPELGNHEVLFCATPHSLDGLRINEIKPSFGFWDRLDAVRFWEHARRQQLTSTPRPKPDFDRVLKEERAQRYAQAL